jgi:nuclear GTP-binding protein
VAGKVADEKVMADQKVIVTEWAKEFKLEGLWEDEAATEGEGNEVEMQ